MRRIIIFLFLAFTLYLGSAQDTLHGVLIDSTSNDFISFAHVRNISKKVMAVSDHLGQFQVAAATGDTIIISSVGYVTLGWIVKAHYFSYTKEFKLPLDTILLKDVTVNSILSEERFKKAIVDHNPEDSSFWYHGMAKPKPRVDPSLNENYMKHPLSFVTHPLTAFYYRFSKQEKERRKHHKVSEESSIRKRVNLKFTREWVSEVTALEADELTGFIAFCDFSMEYLDKTPLYMIQEDMLVLLPKFKDLSKD